MFNVFKKILTTSKITEEDAKKVSPFILLRWLSGDARLMPLAHQLNQVKTLPDNLELLRCMQASLKGKVKFIPYPSSKKADSSGLSKQDDCLRISQYFDVGLQEAEEYWDWMQNNCPGELQELRKMYKVQD